MGSVAKSYMRKGFLIYEEMRKYLVIYSMKRPLVIYDFATAPFWISLYIRKIIFFFINEPSKKVLISQHYPLRAHLTLSSTPHPLPPLLLE